MSEAHEPGYLPLQRSEALTDGIFAVAMTLLVIELKLPEQPQIHTAHELNEALFELAPKAMAWALSFFVLALFWVGHHRSFANLRRADSTLVRLNLLQLAAVSLMPFASALSGEQGNLLVSQALYSLNMALLGITALLIAHHVYRHPELRHASISRAHHLGVVVRIGGLILISLVAFGLATVVSVPSTANLAFLLMILISPASRWVERRAERSKPAS